MVHNWFVDYKWGHEDRIEPVPFEPYTDFDLKIIRAKQEFVVCHFLQNTSEVTNFTLLFLRIERNFMQ